MPAGLYGRLKQNQAKHSRPYLPALFPTDFPTRPPIPSRPTEKSCTPIPSLQPNGFHLAVPFPTRGKQTGRVSHTVPREDPKQNSLGQTRRSHLVPCGAEGTAHAPGFPFLFFLLVHLVFFFLFLQKIGWCAGLHLFGPRGHCGWRCMAKPPCRICNFSCASYLTVGR